MSVMIPPAGTVLTGPTANTISPTKPFNSCRTIVGARRYAAQPCGFDRPIRYRGSDAVGASAAPARRIWWRWFTDSPIVSGGAFVNSIGFSWVQVVVGSVLLACHDGYARLAVGDDRCRNGNHPLE